MTPESGVDFYEPRMRSIMEALQFFRLFVRAMRYTPEGVPRPKVVAPTKGDLDRAKIWLDYLEMHIKKALDEAYSDGYMQGLAARWEFADLADPQKAGPAAKAFQALKDLAWAAKEGALDTEGLAKAGAEAFRLVEAVLEG